jgi:hypothetical protein
MRTWLLLGWHKREGNRARLATNTKEGAMGKGVEFELRVCVCTENPTFRINAVTWRFGTI